MVHSYLTLYIYFIHLYLNEHNLFVDLYSLQYIVNVFEIIINYLFHNIINIILFILIKFIYNFHGTFKCKMNFIVYISKLKIHKNNKIISWCIQIYCNILYIKHQFYSKQLLLASLLEVDGPSRKPCRFFAAF